MRMHLGPRLLAPKDRGKTAVRCLGRICGAWFWWPEPMSAFEMAFSSAPRWWEGLIRLLSSICAPSLGGSRPLEHLCAEGPEICRLLPGFRDSCAHCLIDIFMRVPAGRSNSEHPNGTHRSSLITKMARPSPQAKTECRVLGSPRVLQILLSEHPSALSLFSM